MALSRYQMPGPSAAARYLMPGSGTEGAYWGASLPGRGAGPRALPVLSGATRAVGPAWACLR